MLHNEQNIFRADASTITAPPPLNYYIQKFLQPVTRPGEGIRVKLTAETVLKFKFYIPSTAAKQFPGENSVIWSPTKKQYIMWEEKYV